MSKFEKLKAAGNALYMTGTGNFQKPKLANEKFSGALDNFYAAQQIAATPDEISSIKKNIGMTNFQLALLMSMKYEVMGVSEEDETLKEHIIFYAKQSLKHLFSALQSGESKPLIWINRLKDTINIVCDQLMSIIEVLRNLNERIAVSYALISLMKFPERKGHYYSQLASSILKQSVIALADSDYTRCLAYAKDMNYPLSEAERLLPSSSLELEEVRRLRKDAFFQQTSADSKLIIDRAKQHLDTAVMQSEDLDMDMVYETLDMFKSAALRARETVLDHEAMACYYQGHIVDKILKRTEKAQEFYHKAIELAMALHPRVFTGEVWYDDCTTRLEEIQLEIKAKAKNDGSDDQKLKMELEKELNEITAARTTGGGLELLRHIYTNHPPKDPTDSTVKLENVTAVDWNTEAWVDEDGSKRKLLRKVLRDYCRDKVDKKHGPKWLFLVGEIAKQVNAVYDVIKEGLKYVK